MTKKRTPRRGRPPLERVANWSVEKYRAKCVERQVTQADVAEGTGYSRKTVEGWSRGAPTVEQGPKIVKFLGTRMSELTTAEDEA